MKQLLMLLVGLFSASLLSAGELDLSIPEPAKIDKSLNDEAPCKGCGVVTNVRQLATESDQTPKRPDSPYLITFAEASRETGGGMDMTGSSIKTWEEWPEGVWQTTVRLDDGSYSAYESEARPSLQEGDRVQVISGKLVPR